MQQKIDILILDALRDNGYTVLRFSDQVVQSDGRNVAARVREAVAFGPVNEKPLMLTR